MSFRRDSSIVAALTVFFFFLMIRRPPRSTLDRSSAASDVYKRQRRYYSDHLRQVFPGYFIFEATTGKTGLDLYEWQPINCVILYLSLPDMSGFHVLSQMVPNPSQPLVPVVILTSINSQSILEVAKQKGAFIALQKDLTPGDELARVIQKALVAIPG